MGNVKRLKKKKNLPAKSKVPKELTTSVPPSPVAVPFGWTKICRLCEAKDGPFLNIFDADKTVAKKISYILPFVIAENDELPHKICFRCSAKIEELDEFIQKCINTQANLSKAIGKNGPVFTKTKSRILWEEQLNKSNVTNDDICDAVIKKAMEGIKSIDLTATSHKAPRKLRSDNFKTSLESITEAENELDDTDQVLPQPTPKPTTTVNNKSILESSPSAVNKRYVNKPLLKGLAPTINYRKPSLFKPVLNTTEAGPILTINKVIKKEKDAEVDKSNPFSLGTSVESTAIVKCAPEPDPAPFDIMDHVITLKVTGVGTLFQCQLCKRNFLKKDVLATHGCTTQKLDLKNRYVQPALPKAPAVKYINTRENKTAAEENNTNPNVEVKKSEIKQYRPGPKSRVGPANVQNVMNDSPTVNSTTVERPSSSKETTKRPSSVDDINETPSKIIRLQPRIAETTSSNTSTPYPVGIFQAVPHHSRVNPAPFYASDAKKQSCTVIQTDSPGKLLISTKPRVDLEVARKPTANLEPRKTSMVQPFRVTSENANPTKSQQYFTFINVDPLVQPSYVLPTDNSAQDRNSNESGDKSKSYTCNTCNEKFTREQKLLAHIKSHYNKMDEKFQSSCERAGPARRKKS